MRRTRKAVVLVATAFVLAACGGNQSALDPHGSSAIALKSLIIGIVAVCSVVWMLVMMALIWALLRPRQPPSRDRARTERRMTVAVGSAVAATAVIIAGFTFVSYTTTRALNAGRDGEITIRVRGLQWWWQLTYLDPDPARTFETANEIHIPVGQSVRLQLDAGDVIHSFWVPSLAGKQDLIPGRKNELVIRAERPGVYRGQCAEFCGLQHSHMAILVIAEDRADYERWAAQQRGQSAAPDNTEAAAGQSVFLAKPCAGCHTIRGTGAKGIAGPDLTHVGSRRTIAAGVFETTRGSLAAWIADPQTIKPGNTMPMVQLSSDELRQLSAYMASLK